MEGFLFIVFQIGGHAADVETAREAMGPCGRILLQSLLGWVATSVDAWLGFGAMPQANVEKLGI